MTDDELRVILGNLALAQIKTEEQLAKTDAQLSKTDAKLGQKTDFFIESEQNHIG